MIQVCDVEGVNILKGVVSKDHMHIEYRPSQDVGSLVKKLKGRSSRRLQQEFPTLKKRYWGRNLWALGFGQHLMQQADFIKFNDDELFKISALMGSPYNSLEHNLLYISERTITPICVTKRQTLSCIA